MEIILPLMIIVLVTPIIHHIYFKRKLKKFLLTKLRICGGCPVTEKERDWYDQHTYLTPYLNKNNSICFKVNKTMSDTKDKWKDIKQNWKRYLEKAKEKFKRKQVACNAPPTFSEYYNNLPESERQRMKDNYANRSGKGYNSPRDSVFAGGSGSYTTYTPSPAEILFNEIKDTNKFEHKNVLIGDRNDMLKEVNVGESCLDRIEDRDGYHSNFE